MRTIKGQGTTNIADRVLAVVFFRPKNGHELLHAMENNIICEIVDTHAFIGAKMLEENLGASFSFKLSEVNKGWTLFKRS